MVLFAVDDTGEQQGIFNIPLCSQMFVILCSVGGVVLYVRSRRKETYEAETTPDSEPSPDDEPAEPFDADAERLRATLKSVRRSEQENAFALYRALFIEIIKLDNYSAREIAAALGINKDQAAAATAYLFEQLGALRYRGATPQTGYALRMDRDALITRLENISRAPLPSWPCPEFVVPDNGQDTTEDIDRQRQTAQTEILVFGSDGKPIL